MTSIMTLNYLFFIGIIIPTVITISLFIVFIVCWYRIKTRRDIMHKRHDPHGTLEKMYGMRVLQPEPPPLPKWNTMLELKYNHNNNIDNTGYEKSPDTEGPQSQGIYHTFHDSGMTELSEIHYKLEPTDRPKSQASTDSEDSGFRSSRSAQYIHSASSSNATQETPLFKPISSNKDDPCRRVSLPPAERKQKQPCKHKRHSSSSPSRKQKNESKRVNTSSSPSRNTKNESKRVNNTPMNHLPIWTSAAPPRQLTLTTAMVHRPNIEEITLGKCYTLAHSVV